MSSLFSKESALVGHIKLLNSEVKTLKNDDDLAEWEQGNIFQPMIFFTCLLYLLLGPCIPANFFRLKCVRFSSYYYCNFPKCSSGFQTFPKIFGRLSKVAENVRRCSVDL